MIITPLPNEPKVQCARMVIPAAYNQIAVIGDCPYDEKAGLPFCNSHYGAIAGLLRKTQRNIDNVIVGNLLKFYPTNGYLGQELGFCVQSSLDEFRVAFTVNPPKVIIILGRQTLRFFKPGCSGLDEERGAPFLWNGILCIATYHPKEMFVENDLYPIVEADFGKAVRLARDGWSEVPLEIIYGPSYSDCIMFLSSLLENKPYISADWESIGSPLGPYSLATCIGFGINGKRAFTIPFVREGNKHYFSLDEEIVIWRLVARVLETCPSIGHNSVHYDHWFAAYWCGILMNVVDDTMFAHWEIYQEMPKSLAFCASLYLDTSYWKDDMKLAREGKVPRDREFKYNGRDNCITLQVAAAVGKEMKELPSEVRTHYKFNIRCSRVFQYMALRGCVIDREKLKDRIVSLEIEATVKQETLNDQAGKEIMVTSPKKMQAWLYDLDQLGLPKKYKAVKLDDGSMEDRETADFLAISYLAREYPTIPALTTAALLRKLKKRVSSLKSIVTGPNGECWWNFNLVGTESGRASGYKPSNGMGVQPQNPDKRDRDLFLAGYGMMWAKCDLEGADAWTIAAQLLKLSDRVMWDDLNAGIKPAMILSLCTYLKRPDLIEASVETLVPLVKANKAYFKTTEGKIVYDADKSVSHGTNYMMQAKTMHETIFRKSKAEIWVPINECERRRLLYLKRYKGLSKLYDYIPTIINSHGLIDCPSGMRRLFFGRNDNHRTRVGLSLIPQNNTAFATNRALHNLYYESYNRRAGSNELVVQPMNQVHDEMDNALFENEISTVRNIFQKATDFTSQVWGVEFRIPFDLKYGPNWGQCETPIYGDDD